MTNQVIYFNEEQTKAFIESAEIVPFQFSAHKIMTVLTKQIETFVPGTRNVMIIEPEEKHINIISVGALYNASYDKGVVYNKHRITRRVNSKKVAKKVARYIAEDHFTGAIKTTIIVLHGKDTTKDLVDTMIEMFHQDNISASRLVEDYLPVAPIIQELFMIPIIKLPVIKFPINEDYHVQMKRIGNETRMMLYRYDNNPTRFPVLVDSKPVGYKGSHSFVFHNTHVLHKLLKFTSLSVKPKLNKEAVKHVNKQLSQYEYLNDVSKWYKPINTPKVTLVFVPKAVLELGGHANKVIYLPYNGGAMILNDNHQLVKEALEDANQRAKKKQETQEPKEINIVEGESLESIKESVNDDASNFIELPKEVVNNLASKGDIVDIGEGVTMDKIATLDAPKKSRTLKDRNSIMKKHIDSNDKPAPSVQSTEQSSEENNSSES